MTKCPLLNKRFIQVNEYFLIFYLFRDVIAIINFNITHDCFPFEDLKLKTIAIPYFLFFRVSFFTGAGRK